MYGKKIKQLRKNVGLNQADLARMVGVSRPNISFWENAQYPPLEAIVKICKVFGIEVWRFFADDSFDAQVKNLSEKYSDLQREILQLSNEEYEDLMNIVAMYIKKHTPRYTSGTDLKIEPQTIEACNDPDAELQKRQAAESNINFIFSYTTRKAAYNAIVNYTERFLRIM
jgi:transcriptional regulator with XRE-family HTH domain